MDWKDLKGGKVFKSLKLILLCPVALTLGGCTDRIEFRTEIRPNQEDVLEDGSLYSPATQSFLRTHHWLDTASRLEVAIDGDNQARLIFQEGDEGHEFSIRNLPMEQLVPRLHYQPADPPDDFDAFNLLMAEYARNGVTIPRGEEGDEITHFQSDFQESVPWILEGDYQFVPNKHFRPLRVGVMNNCLAPGLWELNAVDRSGEIYHAWFDFPVEHYYRLTAEVNGLDSEFVKEALKWKVPEIKLPLERLRQEGPLEGTVAVRLVEMPVGFSSQDSRRKLAKGFVQVMRDGALDIPEKLSEFYQQPVSMSSFIEPGKYASQEPRDFDLRFLAQVSSAEVRRVTPHTHYSWNDPDADPPSDGESGGELDHLQIMIRLGDRSIVIGNLPINRLVRQEDYVINGFGVGVLGPSTPIERRKILLDNGPHPPYAYLVKEADGELLALNSHDLGIEQIFIRTLPFGDRPHWTVTITSYERIVDLVKYEVEIPESLRKELIASTEKYVPPLYRTYRDDNVR